MALFVAFFPFVLKGGLLWWRLGDGYFYVKELSLCTVSSGWILDIDIGRGKTGGRTKNKSDMTTRGS